MNLKYRIISVDTNEHSIIVRYFTDIVTEEMLATELDRHGNAILNEDGFPTRCRTDYHINIFDVPAPSGEELAKIIRYNAPVDWLRLKEQVLDPDVDTSLSNVGDMLNVVGTVDMTITTPPVEYILANTATSNT